MRFLQCQKNTMTIGLTLDFTGSNLDFFILQRTKNRGSRNKMIKKMSILFFSREETRCGNREIREKKKEDKKWLLYPNQSSFATTCHLGRKALSWQFQQHQRRLSLKARENRTRLPIVEDPLTCWRVYAQAKCFFCPLRSI